jgi:murein DD-endopeptidase MepM/ murein hydrolase activator NlpD
MSRVMSQPGTDPPLTRRAALARERQAAERRRVAAPPEAPPPPQATSPSPAAPARATPPPPPRAPRGRIPGSHSFARGILGLGVLLFVAAMVVGLSIPANALYNPGDAAEAEGSATNVLDGSGQRLAVRGSGESIATTTDDYTASTKAQLLAQKYSGGVGGEFHGPVRWPFPYKVAILSPFGPRGAVAGCPTCAPFHRGVDLNGGNGNPISSIMDGTVTERSGGSWTYGNYAIIVGHYQGHEVKAIYEHMQEGSSPLVVGQQVAVGDFVGLVGATGETTAPHLHLELDVDGQLIDPIPWLDANAS